MKHTKKLIALFAILLIFITASVLAVSATGNFTMQKYFSESEAVEKEGQCGENVYYTLYSDGTLRVYGSGDMYDYSWEDGFIPSYRTVEWDGEEPLPDSFIKTIIIEEGVTSVGDCTFNALASLERVEIADTVTSIGICAFDYCTGLKDIVLPDSVTVIKQEAFSESGLETITLSENLKTIDIIAFLLCENLKEITIPKSVERIGEGAFMICPALERITILNSECILPFGFIVDCDFGENGEIIPKELKTVIVGYGDSTAEEYAAFSEEVGYPVRFEKIPHEHSYNIISVTEADCTENGYTNYECTECGHKKTEISETAKGHNYSEKIVDSYHLASVATYTSKATYYYDCTLCDSISKTTFEHGEKLVGVSSVSISDTLSLTKDSSKALSATVLPSDAADKTLLWSSSNTKVATVDSKGNVTAKGKGTAVITAESKVGKKKDTCTVTVTVPVKSVSLSKTETVVKNKTITLTATVSPSDANNKKVTWSSSDTKVATVNSSSGVVTGKAPGTAVITVKTADGNKTAKCTVTVKDNKVTGVKLSSSAVDVVIGKTATLTATVEPSWAANKAVKWVSSNTEVATVSSSGKVTAVAEGEATVTVTTNDGSKKATCKIYVVKKYKRLHPVNNYKEKYELYKDTYLGGFSVPMDGSGDRPDYVIPGQKEKMVPQGLAYYAGKQWFLAACYSKESKQTVIFALKKSDGTIAAQFNLQQKNKEGKVSSWKPHAGGIAVSKYNLYITNSSGGVVYVPLDELNVKDGTVKNIIYKESVNFEQLGESRTAYMSISDSVLWTGNFFYDLGDNKIAEKIEKECGIKDSWEIPASKNNNSVVLGFKLSGDSSQAEWDNLKAKASSADHRIAITNKLDGIQGVSFRKVSGDKYRMYLSRSAGVNISGVLKNIVTESIDSVFGNYNKKVKGDLLKSELSVANITLDKGKVSVSKDVFRHYLNLPGAQNIVFVGDDMYMNYESGALKANGDKAWQESLQNCTDVLWKLDEKKLKPKKTSLSSVKSQKAKNATLKWDKSVDANGYEIAYSTNKDFKSGVKKVTAGGTSATVEKLTSKKKYYFKIRAFKIVSDKKVYSSYSKVKNVKVK